jgi:ABC-2 type transport system ATP-binding protein
MRWDKDPTRGGGGGGDRGGGAPQDLWRPGGGRRRRAGGAGGGDLRAAGAERGRQDDHRGDPAGVAAAGPGRVRVLGMDPQWDGDRLRRRIGAQLQSSALPDRLRVEEALWLFARGRDGAPSLEWLGRRWGLAGGWRGCGGGRSPSCQGVSSSGCSSRWPWSTGPRWCSSTSSPPGWTRRPGGPPGTWSAGSGTTAPRWCSSPTSWRRPRSSATGWRSSTGAGWWPPGRRRSWSGGPTPPSGSASPGRTRTPPGCPTSPGSGGSPAVATPSRSSATAPWPSGWPRGLASRGVAPDDFRTHHPDLEDVFLALTGRDLRA